MNKRLTFLWSLCLLLLLTAFAQPITPMLDIEWFFTPGELCDLMAGIQDLDLMTVSPGVANPAEWTHVAFKGGSELGVLNLTHWLVTADGATYYVVVTQNRDAAAVDETLLANLTRTTIGLLGPSLPITNSTGLTETVTLTAMAPTTATGALTASAALTAATAPTITGALTATTAPTATGTTTGTGALTTTAPLVFTNVRLFDGERVLTATNVVVEDGLITAVGTDVELPADAQVIDGAGKTLLPGLIDAHTHVFSPDALRQALVFGVTTAFRWSWSSPRN